MSFDGKRLISVTLADGNHFEYKYNVDGLRIKRSGNRSGPVTYSYSGNKLILQESSSLKLEFLYDEKDNLYGFIKNNNERYYYIRDALGNILGIISQNGQIVVQYSYTSYGVCSISGNTSLGNENPFRYKGYYYDVETSLYYITSRYYDPEIGRFISPDSVDYLDPQSINGLNLYAYCENDPVNYYDPTGHSAILIGLIIGAIIGAGIGFGTVAYTDYQDDGQIFNGSVEWYDYLGATILGGAIGAGIGAGIGYIAPQIGSALSSFASQQFTFGAGAYLSASGELVMSTGLTITGAQVLTVAGALTLAGTLMFMSKHRPGMTNRPPFSWTTQEEGIDAMNKFGGDANKAADYIMNNHFDNWKYGAGNDRNVIKKWLDRIIRKLLGM